MKKGDILSFKKNKNIFGRLISHFVDSDIVHTAIAINEYEILEASVKGVRKVHIDKIKKRKQEIILCVLKDEERNKIIERNVMFDSLVEKVVGQPYDYLQIGKFVAHYLSFKLYKPSENNRLNVCSELAGMFLECMTIIKNINTSLLTPPGVHNLDIYTRKEPLVTT